MLTRGLSVADLKAFSLPASILELGEQKYIVKAQQFCQTTYVICQRRVSWLPYEETNLAAYRLDLRRVWLL